MVAFNMGNYKKIIEILSKNPENFIDYIYGQNFEKPFIGNKWTSVVKYFWFLLKSLDFKKRTIAEAEYCIYIGSFNQLKALSGLVKKFEAEGVDFVVVCPKKIKSALDCNHLILSQLSLIDLIDLLFVFFMRLMDYRCAKFDPLKFLFTHYYLILFYGNLSKKQIINVIVSNDHSPANRALIAVAKLHGHRTIYLQHASVSSIFPALNFDISFLDGMSSYKTYIECEKNKNKLEYFLEKRRVYLSGQKKQLNINLVRRANHIGLAVNVHDELVKIEEIINIVHSAGCKIVFRWHPGSKKEMVDVYKSICQKYECFTSDPIVEDLSVYFSTLKVIIANNSSIHMEAALAGVIPIYWKLSSDNIFDYYGYVKNGLAKHVNSKEDIFEFISEEKAEFLVLDANVLQYFSTTYGTSYFGREADLMFDILMNKQSHELNNYLNRFDLPFVMSNDEN